jgi:Flp pilus assembly protein TadD
MPGFNEDRDRQVIPRWRAFTSAAKFGEVASLTRRPARDFTAGMLGPVLEDWHREPGLSVAADVVSAAFSIGCTGVARDAATFVLEHAGATPAAREIAQRCLSDVDSRPSPLFTKYFAQPDLLELRPAIHQAKERLSGYPNNPVLWTNLALFFTTLGQHEQARRAIRIALQLAPGNRFVVRAACRLFVHQGDLEQAHAVLLRSASLQVDPWLLAGEVAVAAIRSRSSRFVKAARSMVESEKYSPFHLSELTGALATMEARDGGLKKAKRLCALSLVDPSENAIAQAAWLGRKNEGMMSEASASRVVQSSEANAWLASVRGDWNAALREAKQWQDEQPFSSRPAILGGHIASCALEDFDEAETILRLGLRSNRDDAMLYNNLAFTCASQGKIVDAKQLVEQGFRLKPNIIERICLTATQGLVDFRCGEPERGRQLYYLAIAMAGRSTLDELAYMATIYHALEELRVGSPIASARKKDALGAVEKLSAAFRPVFAEKLRKARPLSMARPQSSPDFPSPNP